MFFGYSVRSPHRTAKPSRGCLRVVGLKPHADFSPCKRRGTKVINKKPKLGRGCPSPRATSRAARAPAARARFRAIIGARNRALRNRAIEELCVICPVVFLLGNFPSSGGLCPSMWLRRLSECAPCCHVAADEVVRTETATPSPNRGHLAKGGPWVPWGSWGCSGVLRFRPATVAY